MTTRIEKRGVRRLLALTLVVVLLTSVVGPAGIASAALTSAQLDGNASATVQPGATVSATVVDDGTNNGTTLFAVIDENSNGNYNTGEESANTGSTDSGARETVGNLDTTGISDGNYTVYFFEEDSLPSDGTAFNTLNGTTNASLTVDGTAPTFSNKAPTGTVVDDQSNVTVDIADATSAVNTSTIVVNVSDSAGAGNNLLSQAGTGTTGVSFSGGTLTVDPATAGFSFADGTVDVEVAANDTADNTGTTSFSFTVAAGANDKPRTAIASIPATMFLGEEGVDVTGPTGKSGTITFTGVAGDANGDVTSDDAGSVDFTAGNGFDTGGYNASVGGSGSGIDFSVREASVTAADLYLGGTDAGAEVSGTTIPATASQVTVDVNFNFAAATYAEITVTDEAGLDVTNQVLGGQPARINTSGSDDLVLDVSGLSSGTYTVEAAGQTGSGLEYASRTVNVTIGDTDAAVSLDSTEVTQGESVVATLTGTPGYNVTVRTDSANLDNTTDLGTQATNLFANTGDVLNRTNDSDQVAAVVDLGDDGQAQLRIDSAYLKADNTGTFEIYANETTSNAFFAATADADVDLTVNARGISVSAPRNVVIGETFDLTGNAAESDNVYAYALINDNWQPLTDDDSNTPAVDTSVASDGSYTITVDSSARINIPGSYQVGVIAGSSVPSDGNSNNGNGLTRSYFSDGVSAKTSVNTQTGTLSASTSESRIAVGDDLDVTGAAIGQGSNVRIYVVGPRGGVGYAQASVDAETNEYEATFGSNDFTSHANSGATFDNTGTHQVIVVSPGRDGSYANSTANQAASGALQDEQVALIEDAYTGPGVDDQMQRLSFVAENANIDIDHVGVDGKVAPATVTVSGTSNRADGTDVFVDVVTADGTVLASETATVDGPTDAWSTELDLSDVSTGQTVDVIADDGTVTDRVSLEVVAELPTTTAPPTTTTATGGTTTAPPTTTTTTAPGGTGTTAPPSTTTEPPSGQPGFGIGIALVALLGAGLLALRRRG